MAGTDSGIFSSREQGQNWQASQGAASGSGRVTAFVTLGQTVYAGTHRSGILESSDQGTTWVVQASFPSKNVRSLLGHQRKLYAGTDADGVFVSSDHGQRWTRLDTGLPQHAQVFALAALKGTVFAGLYSHGLYRWDDQARRWTRTGPVTPLVLATIGDTLVVGHNPGGISTSDDLGVTWTKAASKPLGDLPALDAHSQGELSSHAPVWELASNPTLVFAGAGPGIYYSEDQGRTWTRAHQGLPETSPGVAFLLQGDFILAATHAR